MISEKIISEIDLSQNISEKLKLYTNNFKKNNTWYDYSAFCISKRFSGVFDVLDFQKFEKLKGKTGDFFLYVKRNRSDHLLLDCLRKEGESFFSLKNDDIYQENEVLSRYENCFFLQGDSLECFDAKGVLKFFVFDGAVPLCVLGRSFYGKDFFNYVDLNTLDVCTASRFSTRESCFDDKLQLDEDFIENLIMMKNLVEYILVERVESKKTFFSLDFYFNFDKFEYQNSKLFFLNTNPDLLKLGNLKSGFLAKYFG